VRRSVVLVVALLVAAVGAVAPAPSVAKQPTRATAAKKKCAAKHRGSSNRARAARRRCVAKAMRHRKAAAKRPLVAVVPAPVVGPVVVETPAVAVVEATPAPAAAAPAPVASAVGVEAFDVGGFALRLSRLSVPAGTLTVYFRNRDISDHNLWIDGPGLDGALQVSGNVGENGTASKKLAVTAGAWRLFCSLPGHEAMSATLTVG
jgi:plastocyanin